MDHHLLIPHPDFAPPASVSLTAAWAARGQQGLMLEYHVTDPAARILWPDPATGRSDRLWMHSCFEAFVGSTTGSAYAEFNFAPSGAWAAYGFDDYRTAMRDLPLDRPPAMMVRAPGCWTISLDLAGLDALIGLAPWRLALTAVIELGDGSKSYWSLAHALGQPDFHHPDCFAARLG